MQQEVVSCIETVIPNAEVIIQGSDCNCEATVVSEAFEGLNTVKRQQLVYQGLQDLITSGKLHAISLKTYTPQEWSKQHG